MDVERTLLRLRFGTSEEKGVESAKGCTFVGISANEFPTMVATAYRSARYND